ncbi:hypothetical protein WJX74_003299 [Apatococcus lobatus]|uniref:Transcription factor CBF/NF-Y/archaeal histone domain-containing protein n=1 Tax=Apatococcus lobatus TaxID=904363 RepID=A0AAW1RIW2_9CHLO
MAEDADLPKALVKRIVKAKLTTLQPQETDDQKREVQLNKDALLAFAESSKIFIAYVTATANDICKQAKRQIISGEDVATALEELEFDSFVGPIRQSLESFKRDNKEKNKRKAEQLRKRKAEKAEQVAPQPAEEGDKRLKMEPQGQQTGAEGSYTDDEMMLDHNPQHQHQQAAQVPSPS